MGYGKGETIRVGIIGCGGIANGKHIPGIQAIEGVEIVALCDIIVEKAEKTKERHGLTNAKIYQDYKELLKDESIDDVQICTPNRSHSFITIDSLEAGKNVMVEKPMAINAVEAKKMLDAAKRTGKALTVAYQNRQKPEMRYLRDEVAAGTFGDIYYAQATAIRRRGVPTWGVFMNEYEQGGGPLIDICTHSLDGTLWVIDNYKPKVCFGKTFHKLSQLPSELQGNSWGGWDPEQFTVEDSAFGMCLMEDGTLIRLETSWALNTTHNVPEGRTAIFGTLAGADCVDSDLRINGVRDGRPFVETITCKPSRGAAYFDGVGDEDIKIREQRVWYNYLRGEGELFVKPEQAYVVSQILEGIYESDRTGKEVVFD
ncbi:MAG: Gfo/Idh/MocA family oxidoreductase [Clostridia bacterium]|nr:Gfo/Idh/MocA family oxidoreductase [Clostridia bacterium]